MIGVLLVDDEALTLELHRRYVERVEGFRVVGECSGAHAALKALSESSAAAAIDLVLLDMTMPDGSGLDLLRRLRARRSDVDVIAVTAVRDAEIVHQMAALGVVQYLVKPFSFAVFADRLEQFREYRRRAARAAGEPTQDEIDALLGARRPTTAPPLPKGLSPETLHRIRGTVRERGALSAAEAASQLGMSRVAARRYLEYLADAGRLTREPRYGAPGRPETEYRWR